MEEYSFALAVVGVLLTIVFGFWGGKAVLNRYKQKQNVSKNSTAIMAGGNVTINKAQESDDER